jgi:hypothetical protein
MAVTLVNASCFLVMPVIKWPRERNFLRNTSPPSNEAAYRMRRQLHGGFFWCCVTMMVVIVFFLCALTAPLSTIAWSSAVGFSTGLFHRTCIACTRTPYHTAQPCFSAQSPYAGVVQDFRGRAAACINSTCTTPLHAGLAPHVKCKKSPKSGLSCNRRATTRI